MSAKKLSDKEFVCMEVLIDKLYDISISNPRGWRSRLARHAGVSPAYVTLLCEGKRIPSLYVFNKIMQFQ